jgi:hypothetical protein
MKFVIAALFIAAGIGAAHAQAPGGAPAGTTGICKDGTYSDALAKRGACAGHKGVKEWYQPAATGNAPGAANPAATATSPPVSAAAPPAAVPTAKAPAAANAPMAGGGNGQVWVNSASKVYHCAGTKYYGKTKAGAYMSEAAAVAAGNHGDHGKACKAA